MVTKKTQIYKLAENILKREPDGITYGELCERICKSDRSLKRKTVNGCVWAAPGDNSNSISKSSKGVYVYSDVDDSSRTRTTNAVGKPSSESEFYSSLAKWMVDTKEVTLAVELGGASLGFKWGTPDVIGANESKKGDIYQMQMELISAEVKIDRKQLVTGFGQACAYCLFSHRSYLVVPKSADDLDRLTSLCQVFGIGLITFDADCVQKPDYFLALRARRQEPDYVYLNEAAGKVSDKLWP